MPQPRPRCAPPPSSLVRSILLSEDRRSCAQASFIVSRPAQYTALCRRALAGIVLGSVWRDSLRSKHLHPLSSSDVPGILVLWYMPVCTATDALRRHSRVLDLAGSGAGNSRLSRRGTPRAMAGTAAAVRTGTKATIAATQFTEKPQSDRPRLYTPSLSTRGRTSMISGRKDARSAAVSSSKLPKKRVYLRSKPELATRSRTPNRRLRRTGAGSRSLLWWWWWCRRCGRHGGRVGAK